VTLRKIPSCQIYLITVHFSFFLHFSTFILKNLVISSGCLFPEDQTCCTRARCCRRPTCRWCSCSTRRMSRWLCARVDGRLRQVPRGARSREGPIVSSLPLFLEEIVVISLFSSSSTYLKKDVFKNESMFACTVLVKPESLFTMCEGTCRLWTAAWAWCSTSPTAIW